MHDKQINNNQAAIWLTSKILLSLMYIHCYIDHRRPSGIDGEFFVQLFVEPEKTESVVDTQKLLRQMFQEQGITFTKVC